MKTSRAFVYVASYSFALPNASHVRCTCAASFADQKKKNDLDASEHLENGRLANEHMSMNVILMSHIRQESQYYAERSKY